jgi:hypothetical protein
MVMFAYAFLEIPMPGVCGLFPKEKEDLVRYYACSLALCTKGCSGDNLDKICLDMDCTTKTCKTSCKSLCDNPPSSWPNPQGSGPGEICGKSYNISLPLEEQIALIGCHYDIRHRQYLWLDLPESEASTEIAEIIHFLNKSEGFPVFDELLFNGMWGKSIEESDAEKNAHVSLAWPYGLPGNIYSTDAKVNLVGYGKVPILDLNVPYFGQVLVDSNEAQTSYGCIKNNECFKDEVLGQCLFKGNLNIWSSSKKLKVIQAPYYGQMVYGAYVFFNTLSPSPATFTINATPCYGQCVGNPKCERIKLHEDACFNVKITNSLGTGSNFNLEMDCTNGPCIGNPSSLGCTEPCTSSFRPNDFNIGSDGEEISVLNFTPTETGTYQIFVTAQPTAAYGPESDILELRVVDFDIRFTGNTNLEVKPNDRATYNFYIDNQLGNDNFQLSYSCPGCTCLFENGQPTYTKSLGIGQSQFKINCSSGTKGTYTINLHALAVNESLAKDTAPDATLKVTGCTGDISLSVNSPVPSAGSVTLSASGLDGCGSVPVLFTVNDTRLNFSQCSGSTGCSKTYTANSPGNYTIYAKIDIDEDGNWSENNEWDLKNLTISEPARSDRTTVPNAEGCKYDVNMCDYCSLWIGSYCWSWADCKNCNDPQSCGVLTYIPGFPPSRVTSSQSNICCTGYDNHSSGPEKVPCLSTDNRNDNTMTTDFYWSGYVQNPRNIYDPQSYIDSNHVVQTWSAYFEDRRPDSINDCYGGPGAPQPLQDLKNYVQYVTDSPWGKACLFTPELAYSMYYSKSWIFMRVAQTGDSRAIYGIEGVPSGSYAERYEILLHKNKTGEWIHAGYITDGNERLRPSGWSWNDIDSMLIGFWNHDSVGYLYWLALLTKGSNVAFCTDGSANEYYRTVDDGKKCYWGVDCPLSGSSWNYGGLSPGVGPFLESNLCDCSSGSCGSGTCNTGHFCFSNVKCMNGGWSGSLAYC